MRKTQLSMDQKSTELVRAAACSSMSSGYSESRLNRLPRRSYLRISCRLAQLWTKLQSLPSPQLMCPWQLGHIAFTELCGCFRSSSSECAWLHRGPQLQLPDLWNSLHRAFFTRTGLSFRSPELEAVVSQSLSYLLKLQSTLLTVLFRRRFSLLGQWSIQPIKQFQSPEALIQLYTRHLPIFPHSSRTPPVSATHPPYSHCPFQIAYLLTSIFLRRPPHQPASPPLLSSQSQAPDGQLCGFHPQYPKTFRSRAGRLASSWSFGLERAGGSGGEGADLVSWGLGGGVVRVMQEFSIECWGRMGECWRLGN